MSNTHEQVEFHATRVSTPTSEEITEIFKTWDDARKWMMREDASPDSDADLYYKGYIDVCIWTIGGARWFGGDDAVEAYREDPDASVFERWVTDRHCSMFDCIGRVP